MSTFRVRRGSVLLALFLLLIFGGVIGLIRLSKEALAQPPWPTPPPGLPFQRPQVKAPEPGKLVQRSAVDGSSVAIVAPSWPGYLPLIPPVPNRTLTLDAGSTRPPILMRLDAGSWEETLQLRFTPLEAPDLKGLRSNWRVVRAFSLEAFDVSGAPVNIELQRPAVLQVPVSETEWPSASLSKLLFVYQAPSDTLPPNGISLRGTWRPLVAVSRTNRVLSTRIISFGTIALVEETWPWNFDIYSLASER